MKSAVVGVGGQEAVARSNSNNTGPRGGRVGDGAAGRYDRAVSRLVPSMPGFPPLDPSRGGGGQGAGCICWPSVRLDCPRSQKRRRQGGGIAGEEMFLACPVGAPSPFMGGGEDAGNGGAGCNPSLEEVCPHTRKVHSEIKRSLYF
jgi:hypothetical protein